MKRTILLMALLLTGTLSEAKLNVALPATSGMASYYGAREQGRRTASGARFDRNEYTCASRTYPLGTLLVVRYPRTHLSVVVRVTDRGPWVKGRVLDLSEQTAKVLGLAPYGVDYVEIEPYHFEFNGEKKGLKWQKSE